MWDMGMRLVHILHLCPSSQNTLFSHMSSHKVSSFHWDHNDSFAQFSGCHALLPDGYFSILSRLAEGLEIHLDTPVKKVELMEDGRVGVTDSKGRLWAADRVNSR